tara:strand:- start:10746 stop:11177 length:432 start_codon:yes stop_codon:yes gene_type:complete
MRINSESLRDLKLLKHYRLIRKWACKKYKITDADLELMFYLDALDLFNKDDFKKGVYYYSWDNRRWNKLLKEDWIIVWRKRNRTTQKYNIYKLSMKSKQLIARVYRILSGEEELQILKDSSTYTNKVLNTAIKNFNIKKYEQL